MITRDNYQEFFLLYVDNELPAADARAVEEWVAANPDLMEEWESLQFCRVHPEEKVIFPGKDSLLRAEKDGLRGLGKDSVRGSGKDSVPGSGKDRVLSAGKGSLPGVASPAATGGYPEYLLSYIDGELSPAERQEAEAMITANAADAAELQHLLLAVSKPDTSVVFPDKSSLYRKEKDRRVIFWLRAVAGAAAVVLIAVPLLIKKPWRPVTPGGAVALQDKKAGGQAAQQPHEPREAAKTQDPGAAREPQVRHEPDPGDAREPREIAQTLDRQSMRKAGPAREARIQRDPKAQREPREPRLQREPQVQREPRPATDVAVTAAPPDPAAETKSTGMAIAVRQVDIPREQSSFATQALLQEDDEKALASANQPAPTGKSKLRGLFRKVARTFSSTAERDGDGRREVLISAFQVAVN
jgi:hypothetical protein